MLAGAVLNSLGALLKLVGSIPAVHSDALQQHNAGFAIAMIGQILTAAAQPFLLYAPTKFAMFWFGEKERTMATSLTSMGESEISSDASLMVYPFPFSIYSIFSLNGLDFFVFIDTGTCDNVAN